MPKKKREFVFHADFISPLHLISAPLRTLPLIFSSRGNPFKSTTHSTKIIEYLCTKHHGYSDECGGHSPCGKISGTWSSKAV
jgi:hypothetical protein